MSIHNEKNFPWVQIAKGEKVDIDDYDGVQNVRLLLEDLIAQITNKYIEQGNSIAESKKCATTIVSVQAARIMRRDIPDTYNAMLVNLVTYDKVTENFRREISMLVDEKLKRVETRRQTDLVLYYTLLGLIVSLFSLAFFWQ